MSSTAVLQSLQVVHTKGLHASSKDLLQKHVILSYRLTRCCKIKPCCEVICSKPRFLPQEEILSLLWGTKILSQSSKLDPAFPSVIKNLPFTLHRPR